MLHRSDDSGLILITQPSHAWISGQLAAQWGRAGSGFAVPSVELRLAAEQHDLAWLDWESRPTLNPETGLPYAFNELPTGDHIALWDTATARALAYGRLPALLISMHGTYLYRRFHDFDSDAPQDAELAWAFLEREERFQAEAMDSLTRDGDISHIEINQDRRLLSLWDAMSLNLCMGFDGSRSFSDVPTAMGDVAFQLNRVSGPGSTFTLDPWPFLNEQVQLQCEGKRLSGPFEDRESMLGALDEALPVSLSFTLRSS